MKTIMPKQVKTAERKWFVIDATGLTLGRLASKIATMLKWKNKLDYAPHVDNGDYVIVLNADKFSVTGKKMSDKMYYTHSGYLWGLKAVNLERLLTTKPTKSLELAVRGMLPKNKLRKEMMSRLKLYTGDAHNHEAQSPETITL